MVGGLAHGTWLNHDEVDVDRVGTGHLAEGVLTHGEWTTLHAEGYFKKEYVGAAISSQPSSAMDARDLETSERKGALLVGGAGSACGAAAPPSAPAARRQARGPQPTR